MDTHLQKLDRALASAIAGLSGEQMSWHPPGKWCIEEILEHLYLTYTGTIKGFEKLLESGPPPQKSISAKRHWQIFVVTVLRYMPEGRTAPRGAQPRGISPAQVRSEIAGKIAAMDAIITLAETRFGRSVPLLAHPILGPLNGRQWRKFHLIHGMHHQKQMLHLRNSFKNI